MIKAICDEELSLLFIKLKCYPPVVHILRSSSTDYYSDDILRIIKFDYLTRGLGDVVNTVSLMKPGMSSL